MNDPTGVVRRSSFVQAGDTFYGMQVDYGPTYEQAINHKRQIGTMWPELPEESPYKLEYRTSLYWIKPRLGSAPLTELKSPVGWWFVRVKPSFSWYYQFSADGTVTWTDPGNSRTGKGRWKMGTVYMDIEWESKSSEKWTLPLHPVGQAGNCLWTNGLQDLRADFGVTPPGHVANPPPNSPVGTWNVRIGKARFRYTYRFDAAGNVRWTDIFSGMTGVGRWKFADDYLVVTWASGSKEHWDTPLDPKNSTGSAQITGEGTLDLRADRV